MSRFRLTLFAGVALLPSPVAAQNLEGRVGRLESEMRAVQRRVFPNGQLVQPEIEAARPALPDPTGVPASAPLDDLTARVSSLEGQVRTLTGQVEQAQYRQRQLEEQFEAFRRGAESRIKALEAGPAPIAAAPGTEPLQAPAADAGEEAAPPRTAAAPRPTASTPRPAPAETAPAATGDRAARLGAIQQQDTGDAGEDGYLYGYRLWQAKLYPEAEAQLKKVVATYPKHRRASWAQNLLGRTYLDQGKPSLASIAFYDNYKKMPDGERAPDSLLYLGQSLTRLKKPADACKVYDELTDVYGGKLGARIKADIAKGRTAAKCA